MSIKLDMVGIVSKDISESIRFYRLLGVEFREPDGPYVEATLPNGLRISLNDLEMAKSIDDAWVEPAGQRIGMAFLCDSPAAVDETYQLLVSEGFHGHKEPWDAFWGQRYSIINDPDGNHVELFAPLA